MKVRLQPIDDGGCSYYRMHQPARVAALEGVDVEMAFGLPVYRALRHRPLDGADGWEVFPKQIETDVIVLQRSADLDSVKVVPLLQRQGIAVVVDIDDDLSCLHHNHPGHRMYHPKLNPDTNWRNLQRVSAMADMVTVSTPALAKRFAPHGRVRVLPNCVPKRVLDMPRESDGRTVGWSGWTVSHPGDLEVTCGGVAEAIRNTGAHFHVVGKVDGVREQLSLDEEPTSTGFIEDGVDKWQLALGTLDVGIVPLGLTRFNEAKSYLKGLEFAARGVPFVASPTPEYVDLAGQGVGLIAQPRARNWRSAVSRLLTDPYRSGLVEGGKAVIAEKHTYEKNAWRWAEAWEDAIKNSHARSKVAA